MDITHIETITMDNGNVYTGEVKDGLPNGQGKYIFANGDVYEGWLKDDERNGQGKYIFANGAVYEGEWKDGEANGQGTMKYASGAVYEGEWKDDKHNGQGKYTFANGDVYEGEWKDNKRIGQGKFTFASGSVYEGEWRDDKRNGQGKYTFASGEVYEGEFKDGEKNGQGKYIFDDGAVYEGEWKDDERSGQGIMKYSDGNVYEGEWKDGRCSGQGTMKYADGGVYEGEFKSDRRSGHGIMKYADGGVYEGEFKFDKRNGQGTMKYADGSVYEGEWKKDLPKGQDKEITVFSAACQGGSKEIRKNIETSVEEYNSMSYNAMSTESCDSVSGKVMTIISNSLGLYGAIDFTRAMCILLLAREGRNAYKLMGYCADAAYISGNLEFCRELADRMVKESCRAEVSKVYLELKSESAEENVADIMGMITDELSETSEEDYEKLLDDLAPLLERWRIRKVPKHLTDGAYELTYEIVRLCFEHKAYRTAMRLWPLVYISDERKKKPNLVKTFILAGKIVYEQGYMEVAKRCFMFADEDSKGKCWKDVPEKYHALLEQETKLELTEEVLEQQKLETEFADAEKQDKERNQLGEKAMEAYKKYADGDPEERLKGIDEAFGVFTEEPELYEAAVYLYFLKANICLEKGDVESAYHCIKKAYACKDGNRNRMVLLCMALVLGEMGRSNEAFVYVFRSYILGGREQTDFMGMIMDELGELSHDDDYDALLAEFAVPLDQWNKLSAPKCRAKGAYERMYEIIRKCYEQKAYRTAAKYAMLLYIADERKENLAKTNLLVGKIMSELDYAGIARLCFHAAGAKFNEGAPEKYYRGEPEFEFAYVEKEQKVLKKKRERVATKVITSYLRRDTDTPQERLESLEEAFGKFREPPEVYSEAPFFLCRMANIYLELDDIDKAYAMIRRAYKCKGGNRNCTVFLGMANILNKLGRINEAAAYVFRCYIFMDEEYVREYLNHEAMDVVSGYLMDAEKIAKQFVNTDTWASLTIGTADIPSGRVIVADPLRYLTENGIAPVLKTEIPKGSYPVEIAIHRGSLRICTARLKIKETAAVRYKLAEPLPETAAFGGMNGFPVGAGLMCFIDAEGAEIYKKADQKWEDEHPGENRYTDYFAAFFAESYEKFPDYQRKGGDFIEWTNPENGERMVMAASGMGDGFYQCFWGYDESGEICELIVPLINPEDEFAID